MNHEPPTLLQGDCLALLKTLPDNSIDAIVTDPPYGLGKEPDAIAMLHDWLTTGHHEHKSKGGFMNREWDAFVPQPVVWRECLRVLKPGGHLVTFAGSRTQDLIGLGLRLAGFEIRVMVGWLNGQSFPKSLDVGKAIDKAAGVEREVVGQYEVTRDLSGGSWAEIHGKPNKAKLHNITAPATPAAQRFDGYGTATKTSLEPILVARKPLEGTVAANVLKWGTGALNIDGCRVAHSGKDGSWGEGHSDGSCWSPGRTNGGREPEGRRHDAGRFPANLIHDGSPEVLDLFPDRKTTWVSPAHANNRSGEFLGELRHPGQQGFNDSGSAARFFASCPFDEGDYDAIRYCAKPGKKERNAGLPPGMTNKHETVKPLALMRYLVRLVSPPGTPTILDPYLGSGTTGLAAQLEGKKFTGIELSPGYLQIARARMGLAQPDPTPEFEIE